MRVCSSCGRCHVLEFRIAAGFEGSCQIGRDYVWEGRCNWNWNIRKELLEQRNYRTEYGSIQNLLVFRRDRGVLIEKAFGHVHPRRVDTRFLNAHSQTGHRWFLGTRNSHCSTGSSWAVTVDADVIQTLCFWSSLFTISTTGSVCVSPDRACPCASMPSMLSGP